MSAHRPRVLVIDDASRGLGGRLLELGARLVHAYDPSASRAREAAADAPRALTVRELPAGGRSRCPTARRPRRTLTRSSGTTVAEGMVIASLTADYGAG